MPQEEEEAELCCMGVPNVRKLCQMHHMGVDRILFVARKVDPAVTREKVRQVVRQCDRDSVHETGEIRVDRYWKRLVVDVTHSHHGLYLSMMYCGPGRVAIWMGLRSESAEEISRVIFLERDPVDEMLMDNSATI